MIIAIYSNDRLSAQALISAAYGSGCGAEFRIFTNALKLLKQYQSGAAHYDAVYIDAVSSDDIRAAKLIRGYDKQTDIVFILDDINAIMSCFEAAPSACILKPVCCEEFLKTLCAVENRLRRRRRDVLIKNGHETVRVAVSEIEYIESSRHNIIFHTSAGEYGMRGKMEDILQQLGSGRFARTHRSFAVNFAHVQKCTARDIYTEDGARIPLSRTYKSDVMDAYDRYCVRSGMVRLEA